METLTVIKHLDVIDYVGSGFISGLIQDVSSPFGFKGVKKTFHYGIVPAVAFSTHAANHAVLI